MASFLGAPSSSSLIGDQIPPHQPPAPAPLPGWAQKSMQTLDAVLWVVVQTLDAFCAHGSCVVGGWEFTDARILWFISAGLSLSRSFLLNYHGPTPEDSILGAQNPGQRVGWGPGGGWGGGTEPEDPTTQTPSYPSPVGSLL